MGPSDDERRNTNFVVEETEPEVYNCNGAEPPVWELPVHDFVAMFHQLQSGQALQLKWECPGRHLPKTEVAPLQFVATSDDDADHKQTGKEQKRDPEPSAFDFDDTGTEASTKVKMTPRTPVSTKTKRVARMDNVLNSIKRQQKAERDARKSQLGVQGSKTLMRSSKTTAASSACVHTLKPGSPQAASAGMADLGISSMVPTESPASSTTTAQALSSAITHSKHGAVPTSVLSHVQSLYSESANDLEDKNLAFSSQPTTAEPGCNNMVPQAD